MQYWKQMTPAVCLMLLDCRLKPASRQEQVLSFERDDS